MLSMIFAIQIMNFGSDSIQKDQNAKNKSKALAGMKKIAGFWWVTRPQPVSKQIQ